MRIAQIIAKGMNGGVEVVIANYYNNLTNRNIHFDFFIENESKIINKEMLKNGDHIYIVPPCKKLIKYGKVLKKQFKLNDYDIIHSHLNTLSVFPLYFAWKEGIKVRIASNHSTSNPKEPVRNLAKNILKLFAKKFATNYCACSIFAGKWLFGDKAYNSGKVHIMKNAMDLNMFHFDETIREQMRKKFQINSSTFVIGHIGRFSKQKNHPFIIDTFCEVLKKNSDSRLILVGQGELKKEIHNLCSKKRIEEKVVFLDSVPMCEISKIYSLFDVFLFPSLYEGFGNVVAESQAVSLECFVSENIPDEVLFTSYAHKLKLLDGPRKWADAICNIKINKPKKDMHEIIVEKGYEIKSATKLLEEYYTKLI